MIFDSTRTNFPILVWSKVIRVCTLGGRGGVPESETRTSLCTSLVNAFLHALYCEWDSAEEHVAQSHPLSIHLAVCVLTCAVFRTTALETEE